VQHFSDIMAKNTKFEIIHEIFETEIAIRSVRIQSP
jgi:hypothetical protein